MKKDRNGWYGEEEGQVRPALPALAPGVINILPVNSLLRFTDTIYWSDNTLVTLPAVKDAPAGKWKEVNRVNNNSCTNSLSGQLFSLKITCQRVY